MVCKLENGGGPAVQGQNSRTFGSRVAALFPRKTARRPASGRIAFWLPVALLPLLASLVGTVRADDSAGRLELRKQWETARAAWTNQPANAAIATEFGRASSMLAEVVETSASDRKSTRLNSSHT